MSRPRTNSRAATGSSSRRKLVLWISLIVFALGAWVAIVVALGGGEEGGGSSDEAANQSEQSVPDQQPEAAAETADEDGEDPGGSGERQDVDDEVLSQRPGGGVPEGEVAIEDEEGRSNGQRGFVSSFVGSAYGYTGEDVKEYRSGYEGYIDTSTYYDSSGGSMLRYYASLVEDGGAENAAVLKEYTILSGDAVETQVAASQLQGFTPDKLMNSAVPEGATVSEVTYAVGNRYGEPEDDEDFGEVYGEVEYLKQRLFLAREENGEGWKILAANSPRQTEDPDADRPPADANKVGEPQGGDHAGHDH